MARVIATAKVTTVTVTSIGKELSTPTTTPTTTMKILRATKESDKLKSSNATEIVATTASSVPSIAEIAIETAKALAMAT